MPALRLGHGEQQHDIGHRPAGHPALAPVDDVVRPGVVEHGAAAHGSRVAAAHRLGERIRADLLTAGDGDQKSLLLLLGAKTQHGIVHQAVVDAHDRAVRGVRLRDLDHRQHIRDRVHARAAVVLRNFDAHQAHVAHFADRVQRELARFVELGGDGGNLAPGKFAHGVAQHDMLFG